MQYLDRAVFFFFYLQNRIFIFKDNFPHQFEWSFNSDFFHCHALQRVLSHQDDTALLKAYIVEWRKFFTQCDILPKPFCQLEITLMGKQGSNKKSNVEDSIVRKVSRERAGECEPSARCLSSKRVRCMTWSLFSLLYPFLADVGHLERIHFFQHQEQTAG